MVTVLSITYGNGQSIVYNTNIITFGLKSWCYDELKGDENHVCNIHSNKLKMEILSEIYRMTIKRFVYDTVVDWKGFRFFYNLDLF